MDRRLTPANGRVAHVSLRGRVDAEAFVEGHWTRIARSLVDLLDQPRGARDRQLLYGDRFLMLDEADGMAFGRAEKDGYVGWIPMAALVRDDPVTHWVAAPASHLYSAPRVQAADRLILPFGARVHVTAGTRDFAETPSGHVPVAHLRPIGDWFDDPVAVAGLFLGSPYLWGGNSRAGVDCSGLVQAALLACGMDCPADSDMQMALGRAVAPDESPCRGDLLFWKGHVAFVSAPDEILHATAYGMTTRTEGLRQAVARIAAAAGGDPIAHRRL